jgi:hypothetical protein
MEVRKMRFKLLMILTAMFLFLNSCSDATGSDDEEFKTINQINFDNFSGWKMIKTSDSCFVVAVTNPSPGIIKFDLKGNKIWENYYDFNIQSGNFIVHIAETSDKGFLISGRNIPEALFLVKTDQSGNLIWKEDSIYTVNYRKALENNLGEIVTVTLNSPEIKINKYDHDGNIMWSGNYKCELYDITFPVTQIYDFAISPTNDIYVIYKSYDFSSLVKIIISNEGEYKRGEVYDINCYGGCIFFKDHNYYIFGGYDAFNYDYSSFLYTFDYTYGHSSKSFNLSSKFDGYYSIDFTNDGGLLATDDDCIVKLDNNFDFDWQYIIDLTATDDSFKSAVELDNDEFLVLGRTEWTENDSIVHGTFLRHMIKN